MVAREEGKEESWFEVGERERARARARERERERERESESERERRFLAMVARKESLNNLACFFVARTAWD